MAKTGQMSDLKRFVDAAAIVSLTVIPLIAEVLSHGKKAKIKKVNKTKRHYTKRKVVGEKNKVAVLKVISKKSEGSSNVLPIDTAIAASGR